VIGSGNLAPMKDMSNSSGNYAHLDATICTAVGVSAQAATGGTTQLPSGGYEATFQSGVWELAEDCTSLSGYWVNDNLSTVPMRFFYNSGSLSIGGNVDAFRRRFPAEVVQDVTLQLTPQGYVKVLRTGEADAYISSTFNTYLGITTNTAEAQVFNFTVGSV
jgi:hypothetical protein